MSSSGYVMHHVKFIVYIDEEEDEKKNETVNDFGKSRQLNRNTYKTEKKLFFYIIDSKAHRYI